MGEIEKMDDVGKHVGLMMLYHCSSASEAEMKAVMMMMVAAIMKMMMAQTMKMMKEREKEVEDETLPGDPSHM